MEDDAQKGTCFEVINVPEKGLRVELHHEGPIKMVEVPVWEKVGSELEEIGFYVIKLPTCQACGSVVMEVEDG